MHQHDPSKWTWLDRFLMRFRWVIIPVSALALPGTFLSYGYAMKLLFEALPLWAWGASIAFHFTVLLGFAVLLDDLELRKSARELVQGIRRDRQK